MHRGTFVQNVVLTGQLDAARGDMIAVPPLPTWQTSIKWLAVDGSEVKSGERVVELDNSSFISDLDAKQQAVIQAKQELQQKDAEWSADLQQKQLDFDKRDSELAKAKLEAAVPQEILSSREYEDRQMKLKRADVEFAKARDVVRSQKHAIESDRNNLVLKLQRAQRAVDTVQDAIAALVLRAPRGGIVVVRDIPWEGRKLAAGDAVWVGFPLALIPELTSLQVVASLADVDDGRIAVGMPAKVTLDGYPTMEFSGRITDISAVAQEDNRQSLRRSFRVVVRLDQIDPARMRPGLSARVVIRRQAQRDALLVPRSALDLEGPSPRAHLAGGRFVKVKIGPCNAQECVVIDGLKQGQRLATENERG
ncbi:MAG: efflux RND transporter periplasmic adaptor subunit [Thermoanaerobaculia bacterium]